MTPTASIHQVSSTAPEPQRADRSSEQKVELPATLSVDLGVRPTPFGGVSSSDLERPDRTGERSPWSGVAQAGASVGTGAKKAGVAIGGFFSRAGQAVGNSF